MRWYDTTGGAGWKQNYHVPALVAML